MDIKYEVILTNQAENELNNIYNYISKTLIAEKAANNLMEKIENTFLILEDMPKAFRVIKKYKHIHFEYRKTVINNYIIVYRIEKDGKTVYIDRIIYGKRNYFSEI